MLGGKAAGGDGGGEIPGSLLAGERRPTGQEAATARVPQTNQTPASPAPFTPARPTRDGGMLAEGQPAAVQGAERQNAGTLATGEEAAKVLGALTPVALPAPSVSAPNRNFLLCVDRVVAAHDSG